MPIACNGNIVPLSILKQNSKKKSQSLLVRIVCLLNRITNKQETNAKLKSNALFPFSLQALLLILYHELINFGLPQDPATCSSIYDCEKTPVEMHWLVGNLTWLLLATLLLNLNATTL